MKEKILIFTLVITISTLVIFSLLSNKEVPPTKIGVLMVNDDRYEKYEGLKQGLFDIGFKEDELSFSVRNAREDIDKLPLIIDSLLNENLDMIVALGGVEATQLKEIMEEQHKTLPVVFAGVAAPKEIGLIDDFLKPGGFFTGINNHHTSISAKRLELLTDLVPSTKRIFTVYDGSVALSRFSLQETIVAAKKLNVTIIPVDINDSDYQKIIENNYNQDAALLTLPSYKIESLTDEFVAITKKYKLPSMALYKHEVAAGFLSGHGASFYEQGYQAARYVSSIIQGNLPSEMPVELPDEIRFMVNEEVVEQLNVPINRRWLLQAEVVESKLHGDEGRDE